MPHLVKGGGNELAGHPELLGVSSTNMADVNAGALGGLDYQGALNLINKISPAPEPVDKNGDKVYDSWGWYWNDTWGSHPTWKPYQ